MKTNSIIWKSDQSAQLVNVLTSLQESASMRAFLGDVMTEKEIVEIGARLEAARMLDAGEKYTDITKETKLSSRTIARISSWLQNGDNGYVKAIKVISDSHHDHILPDRAE